MNAIMIISLIKKTSSANSYEIFAALKYSKTIQQPNQDPSWQTMYGTRNFWLFKTPFRKIVLKVLK